MNKLKKEHLTQKAELKEGFLEEVIPKLSWVLIISKGQPGEEGMEGGHEHYQSEQQRHRRLGNPWGGGGNGGGGGEESKEVIKTGD